MVDIQMSQMGNMADYTQLPATDHSGRIHVVIDTPRGSRAKYKYDAKTGIFQVVKLLPAGSVFPGNFGFIPGTHGGDGDPLDVLILGEGPLVLGTVVTVRLIGVLIAEQTEDDKTVSNDRFLGVVETGYNPVEMRDIDDLHPHHVDEIIHFFTAYNQMEGRQFTVTGQQGAEAALQRVKACEAV